MLYIGLALSSILNSSRMNPSNLAANVTSRERWLGAAAFTVFGFIIVRNMEARPAVEWMVSYRTTDFQSWRDFWVFMKQSRSGISPILAALEIPAQLAFGDTAIVTRYLYRICFVAAFIVPWFALARSRIQFWLSFVTCIVFLSSASKIAVVGGSQQGYDVEFPLTLLLGIYFTARAARATTRRAMCLLAVAAGSCMTAMELLRPFGTIVLIALILYATLLFLPRRKLALLAMMLPILAVSGTWHLKLFLLNDGQLVWSNHAGYNLMSAWGGLFDDKFEVEILTPQQVEVLSHQEFVGTGDWSVTRIDSDGFAIASRARAKAVREYILGHPAESLRHMWHGYVRLFEPKIIIYSLINRKSVEDRLPPEYHPKGPEITLYPYLVWATTAWAFINLMLLPVAVLIRRSAGVLRLPESAILVSAAIISFLTVLGDRGEEARFLFSLLPLLAVYPSLLRIDTDRSGTGRFPPVTWRTEPSPAAATPAPASAEVPAAS